MKTIQCICGYVFETEEKEFAYCPCCENDNVEVEDDNTLCNRW